MVRMILVGIMVAVLATPVVSSADDWYVIKNSDNKCAKDKGPAHFIKIMQDLKRPYRASDTVRDGKIVKTVVIDRSDGIAITYYRGRQECIMTQQDKQAQQNRELDKYR